MNLFLFLRKTTSNNPIIYLININRIYPLIHEASITLISKSDKDHKKISNRILVNIQTKLLNRISTLNPTAY